MSKRQFRIFLSISIVLMMLASAMVLRADVTGSIFGTVRDRSQAIIAGAHVVATNVETNLSRETTSDADGSYRILALPAGHYKLSVTASGFRAFTETDIEVKVNDQLRFEVTLNVGTVTEKVEITANAVQVQTENTQLGDVIGSKKMLALPLNGRSYLDLLGLQAGVAPIGAVTIGGDRPVSGGLSQGDVNAGNMSVNGQRETANAFLVNGGDVSEGRNLGAGLVPNLDSIEEFRLITNSFDAEYGKFSGAVVNAITKSGTNHIHGDVFEFLRNDKMDAQNYFFTSQPRSELRRNQFGYTLGGPVVIPKVLNGKNKLFWFSDYQGSRQVKGAETGLVTVPTTDQRQGMFAPCSFGTFTGPTCTAATFTPNTVDGGDPTGTCPNCNWAQLLTNRLGYTVHGNEPYSFPGCNSATFVDRTTTPNACVFPVDPMTGLANIPQTAWSAPAVKILPFIPAPTDNTVTTNNFSNNSQKDNVSDNKFGERVDFNNQNTGNWSWYYHLDNSTASLALPGASVPGFPSATPGRAQQFVISNAKTLGATAVNEARISFFRTSVHKDNPAGSFASLSSLGFNNTNGLGIIPVPGYPQFVPMIGFSNSGLTLGVPGLNTFQPNTTYMGSDVFSKSKGKHTWKAGGEFRYLIVNERNYSNPNGAFNFNGGVSGSEFADFLLGATCTSCSTPYTQAPLQLLDSRTRYGGAFVQDSWKVEPNFTLNLGLRWEVSMPWYDTQGKIQTFVPGEQSVVFPLSPKGLVFPGDPGVPLTLAPTRYNNFAPRVGLAYSPGFSDGVLGKIFGGPGKSSIRAAYGIYYTSIEDLNLFFEVADAPFGLFWTSPVSVLFDEPFRIRATGQSIGQRFPFSPPIPGAPSNKTLDFSIYEPINFFPGYNIHNKLPYAQHFNLSIQRELTKSTVLTIAYVGTAGRRLITENEANPGDPALCMQINNTPGATDVTAGTAGCGPGNENDVFQMPTATVPCDTASPTPLPGCVYSTRQQILNPNFCAGATPQVCYASGNTNTLNTANSIYHAGQITVERKAGDMNFLAAYTFSKAIDDSSSFGDLVNFANPKLSRGLSSTDITHNFVASYIWAIPFDRAFKRVPKLLTQGWQMQGITRLSTGLPIQMNESSDDTSLVGSSATDMPNRIGNVVTLNPRNANPNCPTVTGCYFIPPANPTSCTPSGGAFVINCTLGTFGTANRRFFHGPGFNNTDFGLSRRINIKEAIAFEIRGEFFNIFNHAQFTNPSGDINNSSFGIVTHARDARIGQVSAKFFW